MKCHQRIPLLELQPVWDELMRNDPVETLRYFEKRFKMKTKFLYNENLQGYGRAPALSYRGLVCRSGLVLFPSTICCAQIGVSAFEKGNHWLDLVLNMWHEERHQMGQSIAQIFSNNPWYEMDAWDYAFGLAAKHGITEEHFRTQLRFWKMNRDAHFEEWKKDWEGKKFKTLAQFVQGSLSFWRSKWG